MRVTNSEVIRNGEQDLMDAIIADLDWGAIEEIFKKEHHLGIREDVECKRGDLVIHDNRVAYKLEFEVKIVLSVLLDRDGNYLAVTSSADLERTRDQETAPPSESTSQEELLEREESETRETDPGNDHPSPPGSPGDGGEIISQMASQVGEMIAEMGAC